MKKGRGGGGGTYFTCTIALLHMPLPIALNILCPASVSTLAVAARALCSSSKYLLLEEFIWFGA